MLAEWGEELWGSREMVPLLCNMVEEVGVWQLPAQDCERKADIGEEADVAEHQEKGQGGPHLCGPTK